MSQYADAIFHSLELTATDFKLNEVVTKSYVDSTVSTAVTALVDNAPAALFANSVFKLRQEVQPPLLLHQVSVLFRLD